MSKHRAPHNPIIGLFWGLVLSMPVWLLIGVAIWWVAR